LGHWFIQLAVVLVCTVNNYEELASLVLATSHLPSKNHRIATRRRISRNDFDVSRNRRRRGLYSVVSSRVAIYIVSQNSYET